MGYRIRQMRPSDAVAVVRIANQAFLETARLTSLMGRRFVQRMKGDRDCLFVAESDDGEVVGFVIGSCKGGRATIGWIAVHPGHQGRGIGGMLLEAVEGKAMERGIRVVETGTPFARTFYEKYGYRCVAVTNWPYFKHVDHVIKFGSLSEYDLLRLVKCAKLFVWPSRGEGFGMPPLEAMAVGQLVVAADNPTNELVVGLKCPVDTVEEVFMPEIGMYYYAYLYRFEELRDAVDYALNMGGDERIYITMRAMREAAKYRPRYVAMAVSQL